MIRKLVTASFVFFLVFGPVTVSPHLPSEAAAAMTEMEITSAQQEALDYLNGLRREMGLQPVQLNPYLNEAVKNHASYLNDNNTSGHEEKDGLRGFTGKTATDRVKAVGGEKLLEEGMIWEGVAYSEKSIRSGLETFLPTAYHRAPLVHPDLTEIGVHIENGTVVVNYLVGWEAAGGQDVVYPYDGQTEVGLTFNGFEDPNPLTQFGLKESGFIISYTPSDSYAQFENVKIRDKQGNEVPVFEEIKRGIWFFYPKKALAPSETYEVTINYEAFSKDGGKDGSKTWSFTTREGNEAVVYTDYAEGKYWSDDMLWATRQKLILGDAPKWNGSAGRYESRLRPNKELTEAEFLTVLFRYTEPEALNDSTASLYRLAGKYDLPTKAVVVEGAYPSVVMDRGTMAHILATKHFGERVPLEEAVAFMYEANLSKGYEDASGETPKTFESYGVDKPLKRAHIATFLRKYDVYLHGM